MSCGLFCYPQVNMPGDGIDVVQVYNGEQDEWSYGPPMLMPRGYGVHLDAY